MSEQIVKLVIKVVCELNIAEMSLPSFENFCQFNAGKAWQANASQDEKQLAYLLFCKHRVMDYVMYGLRQSSQVKGDWYKDFRWSNGVERRLVELPWSSLRELWFLARDKQYDKLYTVIGEHMKPQS